MRATQIPGLSPRGSGPHLTSSGFPCGPSSGFPFARRVLPPRPPSPGFPSSGVLRLVPFGRCPVPVSLRVPFPWSNLHVSATAGRFRRRWSRTAAGTKGTSSAATTSLGSRDPPALQMSSGRARWDVATESPVASGRERRTSPRPNRPDRRQCACHPMDGPRSVTSWLSPTASFSMVVRAGAPAWRRVRTSLLGSLGARTR
jgi:hypothetical protein